MAETLTIYRPVGLAELDLIRASGMRQFPPRLTGQPIFYPVMTEYYAIRIARDWNTADPASGHVGYVTRFAVRRSFLERYEVKQVGDRECLEYWIPAEDLESFSANIVGAIEITHEFRPGK